jgi:surface antigen
MRKFSWVFIVIIATLITPQNTSATTIPNDLIRQTGIKTTIETVTLSSGEELYYDLGLTGNQEAKVRLEILDPQYVDPETVPTFYLVGKLIDYNSFNLWGYLNFDLLNGSYGLYQTDGKQKTTIGEASLIFNRATKQDKDGKQTPENSFQAGGKKGRIDEFYVRKIGNGKSDEKLYLRFHNQWSYFTALKHPLENINKFRFKITIEKSGNELLAAKCMYLKFVPNFLYKFLTGNSSCVLAISNNDVTLSKPESNQNLASDYNDPDCPQANDETKVYSPSSAAEYLGGLLATGSNNWYNKFKCKDPQNPTIPQKARDVYKWSNTWDPKFNPTNYVQCTTFVTMVYNMAGIQLPKSLGDANNWINNTNIFDVYTSGKDSKSIQEGDIMAWDDGEAGHVGVVISIKESQIEIANANSNEKTHDYKWKMVNGKIKILDNDGSDSGWKPDHWMRLK